MRNYLRLLQTNPGFTRLWLSGSISQIGDWFHTIVLLALIAQLSGGSGLALSAYFLANSVPAMLMMPYAGILADRLDRKRLLIASDLLRAVVVVLLLVSANAGLLWAIYMLVIVRASMTAIFDPTKQALTPQVVPEDDLVLANTLGSVSWSAMLALGAVLGGVIASLFGTTTALLLDAGTFVVSAALIQGIIIRKEAAAPQPERRSLLADFHEGLAYARQHRDVGASLLIKGFGSLANMDTAIGIFATQIFVLGTGGEQSLSVLYTAIGIGAVAGPLLFNRLHNGSVDSLRRFIAVGLVFFMAGFLALSGAQSIWIVAAGMLIASMGGSANWTYSTVLIQISTPNHILGRVFSLEQIIMQILNTVMLVLIGALIDLVGAENVHVVILLQTALLALPLVFWIAYLGSRKSSHMLPAVEMGD